MKIKFDPVPLRYLAISIIVLVALLFVISLARQAKTPGYVLLPLLLVLLVGVLLYRLFLIPICMRMGWHARGEELIKGVLERAEGTPAFHALLLNLFYFQFQLGKLDEAEKTLNRIPTGDLPPELRALSDMNRATLYLARDQFQTALDILRNYNVDDFSEKAGPVFLNNLAFAYYGLGINLEEGIDMVDRAFGLLPDARFSGTLAALLFKTWQLDAALKWAEYGIKHVPRRERFSRTWLHFIRARILHAMGHAPQAVASARKALELCNIESRRQDIEELLLKIGNAS